MSGPSSPYLVNRWRAGDEKNVTILPGAQTGSLELDRWVLLRPIMGTDLVKKSVFLGLYRYDVSME